VTRTLSPAQTLRRACLAGILLAVSGCSILPKAETLTVYQLPAASAPAAGPDAARAPSGSLNIATPYSSQAIDSMRVLVIPQASQISAYAGARWSDPGPVLVRNRLVSAFRGDGRFKSVSTSHSNVESDFELDGDLDAFQVEYKDGAAFVHILFDASLSRSSTNRIVATRRFDITQPVQGKEVPEVVQAFGLAADRLSADMIAWTLQHTADPRRDGK